MTKDEPQKQTTQRNRAPKPKAGLCLVQQGRGPQCLLHFTHIYISLYIYLYIDGPEPPGSAAAPSPDPFQDTRQGQVPCLQSGHPALGEQGCWLTAGGACTPLPGLPASLPAPRTHQLPRRLRLAVHVLLKYPDRCRQEAPQRRTRDGRGEHVPQAWRNEQTASSFSAPAFRLCFHSCWAGRDRATDPPLPLTPLKEGAQGPSPPVPPPAASSTRKGTTHLAETAAGCFPFSFPSKHGKLFRHKYSTSPTLHPWIVLNHWVPQPPSPPCTPDPPSSHLWPPPEQQRYLLFISLLLYISLYISVYPIHT